MSIAFNPPSCAGPAFRAVFDPLMEVNPIAYEKGDLTVFKGVSSPGVDSHFSYVKDQGYHVSTYLTGIGKIDQIDL